MWPSRRERAFFVVFSASLPSLISPTPSHQSQGRFVLNKLHLESARRAFSDAGGAFKQAPPAGRSESPVVVDDEPKFMEDLHLIGA